MCSYVFDDVTVLKFVDSSKIRKSEYLEKETLNSLQVKNINYPNPYFLAEVTFQVTSSSFLEI